MLRRVSLELKSENALQSVSKAHGVTASVADCRPFNKTGMIMLLELVGKPDSVQDTISSIRKIPGVRHAYEGENRGELVLLFIVLERPSICRASSDAAIICLECPFNSSENPVLWRFIARSSSDLRQILTNLGRDGIEARIEDVSPLDQKATLTGRQKEIMATAVAKGFFDFPRKVSLTELSHLVGAKPSTVSEIIRSAERRIMQNAMGL